MQLLKYLSNNFYTKQELLNVAKIGVSEFSTFQNKGVMPFCSYKLNLNFSSNSFLGEYSNEEVLEFYAKGYASWLGILQSSRSKSEVFSIFSERYRKKLAELSAQGIVSSDTKVNSGIELHIEEEWGHFIKGIYGLCTKSGLPEDIAAKELSILRINELTVSDQLSDEQLVELTNAVNLLDSASSMFAPHERTKSSRHRLINEVRRKYQLDIFPIYSAS